MIYFSFFFILIINTLSYGAIHIEKYFKICPRDSPDVGQCLVKAILNGLKTMSEGIPELGLPPLDPYYQKDLKMDYNQNQIIAKGLLRDISMTGFEKSDVRNARLKADDDNFLLEVDMFTPRIQMIGKYQGVGGIGTAILLNTSGIFNITMSDVTYTWKMGGKPETINEDVYVRITQFYMSPDIVDLKINVTNDIPQYDELVQFGLKLAGENWKTMYQELLPHSESNWRKIGIKLANKIFLKVPYDILFPIDS